MNKPLKDWTLQEAKEYCGEYRELSGGNCCGCKLFKMCRHAFGSFDLVPPTYKEAIEWHQYPEEEPLVKSSVLVRFKDGYVTTLYSDSLNATDAEVIEWAEIPKGHKEGQK